MLSGCAKASFKLVFKAQPESIISSGREELYHSNRVTLNFLFSSSREV
jgi:hypothetical protein